MKARTRRNRRITMEDHRKAIGRGCTTEEYAVRVGVDAHEAKRLLGVLKNLPAVTIDDRGIIHWLS